MKNAVVGVILTLLGLAATVYGTTLFTQTFPAIPATSIVLTQNCPTLLGNPVQIAPGSSSGVSFGCSGTGTLGTAFTVLTDGVATPSFTLPAPYTSLAMVNSPSAPTGGCSASSGTQITSGTSFSFAGAFGKGNSYNYCAIYSTAPSSGLPTFTITWTQ